jgi:large subunit ribosomal protein L18
VSATSSRQNAREKRKIRVRKKVLGTPERPRLNVFKSAKHIYAQLIDDTTGSTLLAVSTLMSDVSEGLSYTGNIEAARKVGAVIARRAVDARIEKVVFDRNGFLYHGRVKALAEAARENGLNF